MKVDKDIIKNVAELARLKLTDKEILGFVKDFKEILNGFSVIDKCDVKGLKPSFRPVEIKNIMRDDLVEDSFSQEDALSNSEHKKDGYFKGPRAV
ncbi:Asp-tRNA(Asn)/Glu-tRNA(Gln) amidotransferase GatCAB subunit C [Candidatus Woesearchaeota archaeon B3_Woes]|nr:MAG: Asp-tRNA(Asn)/Glu-tRNA(Gln) amidotransferase GatCAB subunit C [Candidatus Woesearchaeota archaeon B3_Woes]